MQSSTKPFSNPKHNRYATKPRLHARKTPPPGRTFNNESHIHPQPHRNQLTENANLH